MRVVSEEMIVHVPHLDKTVIVDRVYVETVAMLQKSSKLTEKKLTIRQESGRTSLCSTPEGS